MNYKEPYFLVKDSEINISALFEKFDNNPFSSTIMMKKYEMKREYMYMANEIITRRFELKVAEHKCTIYSMFVELTPFLSEIERNALHSQISYCDKLTSFEELKEHAIETKDLFGSFLATSIHDFVELKLFFLAHLDLLKEEIPNDHFNDTLLQINRFASQKTFSNVTTTKELRKQINWLKSILNRKQIRHSAKKELSYDNYNFFLKNVMKFYYLKHDELKDWRKVIEEIQKNTAK